MGNVICRRLRRWKLTKNHFRSGVGVGKMLTKKYFHSGDESGKVTYGEGFP